MRALLDADLNPADVVIATLHTLPNLTGQPLQNSVRILLESENDAIRSAAYSTLNQHGQVNRADVEARIDDPIAAMHGSALVKLSDQGDNVRDQTS